MSDLIVIGVCGKARVGKDLAARAIQLHRGCHRIALADGVKSGFDDLDGPGRELSKELGEASLSHRWAWQQFGTEARESVHAPGLWVHLALAKIYYAHRLHPVPRSRFVIPDIRRRLEVAILKHQVAQWHGRFGVVKLTREGVEIPESGHSSETEVDVVPCHQTLENDGTIDDLVRMVCRFFDEVSAGTSP